MTYCPKRNHIKPCWCGGRTERYDRGERGQQTTTIIVGAVKKYANPDYLAAAIGHGIDLQEAMDIVDLALAGREKLSTFQRQLYDEALGVTEDE